MLGLGAQELLIVMVIAFFIFGGKKLPEIGAGLGRGLRNFKKGLKDIEEEVDPRKALEDAPGVRDVQKGVESPRTASAEKVDSASGAAEAKRGEP